MERRSAKITGNNGGSRLFANPLDVLGIYRALKDLRAYYTQHIFNGLQHDAKRTAGYRLMDFLFDAVPLAAAVQLERGNEAKRDAVRDLLKLTRCIIDAVEYLSSLTGGRGISLDQAAYMYEFCVDIERQGRSLAKALRESDGGSQDPQPTGQGASIEAVEGSLPSHAEV